MKYFGMVTEKQCNFLEQIVKPLRWTYTTVIPQNPSYSFQWLIQNIQLTIGGNSLVFHARPYGIFVEIKANLWRNKVLRTNQKLRFSRGRFSNRDNVDNGEKLSMLHRFPILCRKFPFVQSDCLKVVVSVEYKCRYFLICVSDGIIRPSQLTEYLDKCWVFCFITEDTPIDVTSWLIM